MLYYISLFGLLLTRVSGFFINMPFLGSDSFSPRLKLTLIFLITFLIFPQAAQFYNPPEESSIWTLVLFKELMLGLVIGFMFQAVFDGFRLAGESMGIQIGFGMVNVMDPESQHQQSLMEILFFFLSILIFLAIQGHHAVISGIFFSLKAAPLGALVYRPELLGYLVELTSDLFKVAFQLSFPIVGTLFIMNVLLGFMAKNVQRMEVFMLSFPLKIFLGIYIIVRIMPAMWRFFEVHIAEIINQLPEIIRSFG